MALGRIVQYGLESYAGRRQEKRGVSIVTLSLKCLSKPIYVAIFALGLFACKLFLYFNDEDGIRETILAGWTKIASLVGAIEFILFPISLALLLFELRFYQG